MRYYYGAVFTVGTLVGLLGLPASASINQVGTLQGFAEVGKTFWSGNDCDKTGDARVVGRGLYLVGTQEDLDRENQGAWYFEVALISPTKMNPTMEVCGWLGPLDGTRQGTRDRTDGIGPACGASKGHNGMGEIRQNGVPKAKLMHLGWKNAVGRVWPVTGSYQEYIGGNRLDKGKKGTLFAQVFLQDEVSCFDPDGAQRFVAAGTYELINADTKDAAAPKLQHKKCKETDPDTDKEKDQDPGSDLDWKRECPTGKK